mmetsp:Transcript_151914/g.263202  ORF Transcript_151914/g.263202 Transcript_151914/m.263202 type:complete len:715 (-) Transcript_151914:87-2231(-)
MANRTDRTPSPSPLTLRATSPATLAKSEAAYRTDQLSLVPTNKGEKSTYLQGETRRSLSKQTITLKIANSDEQMVVPGVVSTTCQEVTTMLSDFLMVPEHQITISRKTGPYVKRLMQHQQVGLKAIVGGIKSFSPQKKKWSHPIGIIGAGYNGLKTAMTYSMDNDENYVIFDRNDKVGGYCWITGANKTSRLQTELGSFHLWWGQHCINSGKMNYPDCNRHPMNWMRYDADAHDPEKDGWSIWPYKWEIQRHFHVAAEKFGILPHISFRSNVAKMEIVGDKSSEERYYKLIVDNLEDKGKQQEVNTCVIWHYPGSLTRNRIIEYPGEDDFGGEIGYGMNDDTPYDKLANSCIAILGNGAFAVENARTSLECGGTKAYIICRRKNLASPRMPCWFVHQGPMPTPGALVLKMFEPMYKAADFGDPWEYWSVHANSSRSNVTIMQNSRFGIGDVTFLMVAWGLLEYKIATVKRMSHHTLHLSTGEKLENVHIVLKALGLLGDYAVDKLHNMKELVGGFCGGDWRRFTQIDATGMNAANFTTFSTGIGTTDFALTYKFLYDYPKEFYKMEDADFMRTLPRHKAEPEIDKPVYVTEVRHDMSTSFTLDGMCPKLFLLKSWMGSYKHKMYHITHGTERTLEVALSEWNKYQEEWKSRGIEHDYLPYPYTKESVQGWFDEFAEVLKLPFKTSADGPTDAQLEVLGGDVGKAKEWGGGDASG